MNMIYNSYDNKPASGRVMLMELLSLPNPKQLLPLMVKL